MKTRTNKYWETRAAQRMASYERNSAQTINTINRAYDKAIADLEADIEKVFNKFAKDGKMSPEEARVLLNRKESEKVLDAIRNSIKGIKDPDIKRRLLNRLNAPAYSARITRLQSLKEQVYVQSKVIADAEIQASTMGYIDTINDAYYNSLFDIQKGLGVGFDVTAMPTRTIETILKNPWSGEHFSSRVWHNTDVLAEKLQETITAGFMSGKSNRKITQELEHMSDMGKMAAARLVRTETNYMANAAEMESYAETGINEYIFVATLDLRTSDVCQENDRKVFKVKDAMPGKNMPPLHPWCRSTTRAYLGPDTLKGVQRRARDPSTGQTYLVPADMTYQQWYDKHVVNQYGEDQATVMKKEVVNKAGDKSQYQRYRDVLGKDAPKSFSAFREMKYNNAESWPLVKLDYRRRSRLLSEPGLALPNAEKATAAAEKFTRYLFNQESKDGWAKGTAFTGRLGYNKDNWQELQQQIISKADKYPARYRMTDQFGDRYEQKQIIYGLNGRAANVIVGWNISDTTKMTTAYIKEVKTGAED